MNFFFVIISYGILIVCSRIADNLEQCLPNLESLILTGNQIQELGDLDPLASLPKLKMLSLLHNPVVSKEHYRLYVAHKIPQVRILDFRKVKLKVGLYINRI